MRSFLREISCWNLRCGKAVCENEWVVICTEYQLQCPPPGRHKAPFQVIFQAATPRDFGRDPPVFRTLPGSLERRLFSATGKPATSAFQQPPSPKNDRNFHHRASTQTQASRGFAFITQTSATLVSFLESCLSCKSRVFPIISPWDRLVYPYITASAPQPLPSRVLARVPDRISQSMSEIRSCPRRLAAVSPPPDETSVALSGRIDRRNQIHSAGTREG